MLHQTVQLSSAFQMAVALCVSMYPWWTVAVLNSRSMTRSRLLEALCRVPLEEAEVLGDVALLVRGLPQLLGHHLFEDQGGVLLHRVPDVDGCWQHVVLHVDQGQGLFGDVRARRGDGSDGVAAIQRFVGGEDVVAQVAQAHGRLTQVLHLHGGEGQVLGGDHRSHAR